MTEVEFQQANGVIEIVELDEACARMRRIVRARSNSPLDGNVTYERDDRRGGEQRIVFIETPACGRKP